MLKPLLYCSGQVNPPTNGTTLTFLPQTNATIDWSYTVPTPEVHLRTWFFNSSDGSRTGQLTSIVGNNRPGRKNLNLIPRFRIEEPAALILTNVDKSYNGMYTFSLATTKTPVPDTSKVIVYIAGEIG